ncbi:protein of unknown function (plasmid) [Azospirillum baldaniorum]|uniref:Uncharacterized protein n=1 Tax=Azospirillum baldaniorum TaxID=1064539 RepID=A0A9P1JXT0_9PROT|nr:protein of unknown function [Azospirillum baldaniorum]
MTDLNDKTSESSAEQLPKTTNVRGSKRPRTCKG